MNEHTKSLGFPKVLHLRNPSEFKRVYEHRTSVADSVLIVYGYPNGLCHTRLGLSVSKKISKHANVRNRWKRLIREAFRLNRSKFSLGLDLIVLPKRGTGIPGYIELEKSLCELIRRLEKRIRK